jgi:FkbM family methyltransferase
MIRLAFNRLINRLRGIKDPAQQYAQISFAQNGEDIILLQLFRLRGLERPGFIDIGAHHPWQLSNTALLYRHGSRGINVEANPLLHRILQTERPYDTNVQAGIGPSSGYLPFYEMTDASLSTFSAEEAASLQAAGKSLARQYEVPMMTAPQLIEKYCGGQWPALFCIDVEGFDELILQSTEWIHPNSPLVICAETAEYHPQGHGAKRRSYQQLIESKGYHLWADTNLNSIYIRHDFWT